MGEPFFTFLLVYGIARLLNPGRRDLLAELSIPAGSAPTSATVRPRPVGIDSSDSHASDLAA